VQVLHSAVGKTTVGQTAVEQIAVEQTAVEQTAVGQTAVEQTDQGQMAAEQTVGEHHVEVGTVEERVSGELLAVPAPVVGESELVVEVKTGVGDGTEAVCVGQIEVVGGTGIEGQTEVVGGIEVEGRTEAAGEKTY